jgi:mono/diheme cytochrome c family protein
MKKYGITAVLFIFNILISQAHAAPVSSLERISAGEKLFSTNCATCHGARGAGDGPAAIALNPKPRNLQTEPFKGGTEPAKIFATISNGLKGTNMPGFSQIAEDDRWNLTLFVKSLRK